jgi:hypothetical protein
VERAESAVEPPDGAEGAQRGAPAGASAKRRRRRDAGSSAPGRRLSMRGACAALRQGSSGRGSAG